MEALVAGPVGPRSATRCVFKYCVGMLSALSEDAPPVVGTRPWPRECPMGVFADSIEPRLMGLTLVGMSVHTPMGG